MASSFDYPKLHSRAFYAPKDVGNVKKGQIMWSHSEPDEARCREAGYTSASYVRSDYPITMWDKDGNTQVVGKLEWEKEKNLSEVKRMEAAGWTREHVEVPEPKAKKEESGGSDMGAVLLALGELTGQIKELREGQETADEALLAITEDLGKLEKRIGAAEAHAKAEKKAEAKAEKS